MNRKNVKFCEQSTCSNKCDSCDKLFSSKVRMHSTTYHQLKNDITCLVVTRKKTMIADLGCPNTVISEADEKSFKECLTIFQQNNLEYLDVDEKFKFGPSGPYECSRKIRFPIRNEANLLWIEVSLVKANIPMLLGNNILKPLEAEIKLFDKGNGIMRLQNVDIKPQWPTPSLMPNPT